MNRVQGVFAIPNFTLYKWVLGLTAAVVQSSIYFFVGSVHCVRSTELLRTKLDDAIPFIPATSWFYLPVYAGIFVIAIVGFETREHFNRALVAFGLILLAGLAGHRLVAAEYPRPAMLPPFVGPSQAFMAWVQTIDPPCNVFPSLHVAHTSSLALILHHENPTLGRIVIVLAILLAVSTLTTKQHFIADVVSGYALAFGAYAFAVRGLRSRTGAAAKARPDRPAKATANVHVEDADIHLGTGKTG
jgi:membrane-associated phospholipid phosphatase